MTPKVATNMIQPQVEKAQSPEPEDEVRPPDVPLHKANTEYRNRAIKVCCQLTFKSMMSGVVYEEEILMSDGKDMSTSG